MAILAAMGFVAKNATDIIVNGELIGHEDREEIGMDTVLVTYAVSDEAVAAFTQFIEDKKILELENRPESEDFWTDYRPWSYTIVYKDPEGKKYSKDRHYISQYRKYSDDDYELIKELGGGIH